MVQYYDMITGMQLYVNLKGFVEFKIFDFTGQTAADYRAIVSEQLNWVNSMSIGNLCGWKLQRSDHISVVLAEVLLPEKFGY